MKKVYQTTVDKDHGNCMQAVVASLFDLELNEVPNFIEINKWFFEMEKFFESHGYTDICNIYKGRHGLEELKKIAKFDKGVNGYFYATVNSKFFEGVTHAVVVDIDLNIVHDPNPNDVYLSCTPDDIEGIMVVHDMVIGATGKLFTKIEWEEANKEEQDKNTYKQNKLP